VGKHFNAELFGKRLLELMTEHNETTYSLGEFLGLRPSTISRYTTGEIKEPKLPTINAIASKFGVNPTWLMGTEGATKYPKSIKETKKIPLVGVIVAGTPIFAEQNIEDYEVVENKFNADFSLKVKGDSMVNARILDGDVVYIRQQPDVESGEIAAIIIEDEATLKRVYKVNGTVILRAENPNIPDKIFSKKDMKNVRILGKATYFKSEVR